MEYVNHPAHYKSKGFEVIDVIEAYDLDFCLGNVVKYVLRAGKKSADTKLQDLEKAEFYIKRAIQSCETDSELI